MMISNPIGERYAEITEMYNCGFFDDIEGFEKEFFDEKNRFDIDKVYRLWQMFGFGKNTLKYYLIHHDLMPTFGMQNKYKTASDRDALYKECLEKNATWQDVTGYKDPTGDVLL